MRGYAFDLVTLYEEDAREVLGHADLGGHPIALVTDPPYGIEYASSAHGPLQHRKIEGDGDTALRDWAIEWALAHDNAPCIVFGSWKRPQPEGMRTKLIWDKGMGVGMGDLAVPWKPNWEEIYVLGDGWTGRRDDGVLKGHTMVSWVSKGRSHPTQKPVDLMMRLISRIEPHRTIIDPFAGSGATLVAARNLGRRAIGCEIDPQWVKVAKEGLAQETLFSSDVHVEQPELA